MHRYTSGRVTRLSGTSPITHIVNGVLVRNSTLLMVFRAPERTRYPGTWSFPGGHVEQGESLADALKRELFEELCITPQRAEPLMRFDDTRSREMGVVRFHLFSVQRWQGDPQLTGDEHTEMRWIACDTVRDMTPLEYISAAEMLALSARHQTSQG